MARTGEPPKELPAVPEDRLYGTSGYTGPNARELARQAQLKRDVTLTEDLFLTVCNRLVGGEPLVLICADTTMPSQPQLMEYLYKSEKAREMYYAAREMQAETLFEEAMLIARDDSNDYSVDDRGRRMSHNDVLQRAKIKVDQLNRTAAKMNPRRFGDKNFTELHGSADKPLTLQVVTGVPRSENSWIKGELPAPKIIEGTVVKEETAENE